MTRDGVPARLGEVVEDIPILEPERRDGGEDPLHVSAPGLGPRPEAHLAPQDRMADGSFGSIIRRLDAFDPDESPGCPP